MSDPDRFYESDEPDLFDEPAEAAEEAALLRGEAEAAAGKGVPHEEVAAWVRTWGTADEKRAPRHWFE